MRRLRGDAAPPPPPQLSCTGNGRDDDEDLIEAALHCDLAKVKQLIEGGSDMLQLMNLLAFCSRTFAAQKQ